jgi:isoquinoline 1-oxidoreductase beta subunit
MSKLSRRSFLEVGTVAGGGLLLTLFVGASSKASAQRSAPGLAPSAFVQIGRGGRVTIMARSPEVGQGMKTMGPMLIAEELDVDWSVVDVVQADLDSKYGVQFSGGSFGTPSGWEPLRRVGATLRHQMIAAASARWGLPANECQTQRGAVNHPGTGRSVSYAELADEAARLPLPEPTAVVFKDPKQYRIIGKSTKGVDVQEIVTGQPIFGIDFELPGMLYAVFQKCPVLGGKVNRANLDAIKKLPGVRDAFIVDGVPIAGNYVPNEPGLEGGVAIVADRWWQAQSARGKLSVEWDTGAYAGQSSAGFEAKAKELLDQAPTFSVFKTGDANASIASANRVVEATYRYPFIAHAPLEPQNCVARVRDEQVEIWSSSQTPGSGRDLVAKTLGVPASNIIVHMLRAGGGFGRRLNNDYMVEAAFISRKVGKPVKLVWSREDDMAHDYYRPGGWQHLTAALDSKGTITGWRNHVVTYGDSNRFVPFGNIGPEFPHPFLANYALDASLMPLGLRTGALRAPGSNAYAFVVQSFIDEIAHAVGKDPVALRRELLDKPVEGLRGFQPKRMRAVLDTVVTRSGWGNRKLPKGSGLGVAFHYSHQGYFAEVAEVEILPGKRVRVKSVWVAGDVGSQIINPVAAESQVRGSIIDGLSELMLQEITLKGGAVEQSNYHEHAMLSHSQTPNLIDVTFVKSDNPPTGLGEPALPPILPAVANAIFAATGQRLREIPLSRAGYSLA